LREMVSSGIGWVGAIPKAWHIGRIGGLYKHRNTKVSDTDYPPLSVTMSGIMPQLETAAKTDDHDNRKLVKIGDFAINSRSDRRGSCGISMYEGSVSLINTVLEPRGKMVPEYFNYLFHTKEFADEFYRWGHGIVDDLWTTRWQDMKSMKVPCPPLTEQVNIASFLDERCGVIDGARKLIEDEIESLHRLRKATICKAVTKGLNGKVSMRDSGIRWIGHVPSSWVCAHLKYAVNLGHGSDPMTDGDTPVWGSGIEPFKTCGEHKDGPAVLLGRKGSLNNPQFIQGDYWNVDTAFDAKAKSTMLLRYFYYVASSIDVGELSTNTAKPSMTQADWYGITIPYPPLVEQKKIVDYLDERCAAIDSVIDTRTKQLERLEDYRKALIYAYVTGKKEVPAS
jgi:type I restriction enzyme S subunit